MAIMPVRKIAKAHFKVAALVFCLLVSTRVGRADSYSYTLFDGPSGSGSTYLYGINNSGQIVGLSGGQGFLYSNGVFSNLQDYPVGINNNGVVAGYYFGINPYYGAVTSYTYSNGVYTDFSLPNQNPSWPAYPAGINDAGVVVGWYGSGYQTPGGNGFTYNGSTFTTFGLPGLYSTLSGINDSGTIVGTQQGSGYRFGGGLIYANNSFTQVDYPSEISLPPGEPDQTSFLSINKTGQILGNFTYYGPYSVSVSKYFIYSNGTFTDLNLPGKPTAINDEGQIVGTLSTAPGVYDGYIATPSVPEIDASSGASALALLAGALLIARGRKPLFL